MNYYFTPQEIEQFVSEHIQAKINHNELGLLGLDINNSDSFKREFEIYKTALFEGICNGIFLCNGEIEGIEDIK